MSEISSHSSTMRDRQPCEPLGASSKNIASVTGARRGREQHPIGAAVANARSSIVGYPDLESYHLDLQASCRGPIVLNKAVSRRRIVRIH